MQPPSAYAMWRKTYEYISFYSLARDASVVPTQTSETIRSEVIDTVFLETTEFLVPTQSCHVNAWEIVCGLDLGYK